MRVFLYSISIASYVLTAIILDLRVAIILTVQGLQNIQ